MDSSGLDSSGSSFFGDDAVSRQRSVALTRIDRRGQEPSRGLGASATAGAQDKACERRASAAHQASLSRKNTAIFRATTARAGPGGWSAAADGSSSGSRPSTGRVASTLPISGSREPGKAGVGRSQPQRLPPTHGSREGKPVLGFDDKPTIRSSGQRWPQSECGAGNGRPTSLPSKVESHRGFEPGGQHTQVSPAERGTGNGRSDGKTMVPPANGDSKRVAERGKRAEFSIGRGGGRDSSGVSPMNPGGPSRHGLFSKVRALSDVSRQALGQSSSRNALALHTENIRGMFRVPQVHGPRTLHIGLKHEGGRSTDALGAQIYTPRSLQWTSMVFSPTVPNQVTLLVMLPFPPSCVLRCRIFRKTPKKTLANAKVGFFDGIGNTEPDNEEDDDDDDDNGDSDCSPPSRNLFHSSRGSAMRGTFRKRNEPFS